jgi:DNA helicase HerA-like ATPase
MSSDALAAGQWNDRGTDSNSLLRLYDRANRVLRTSGLQEEQRRAARAIARITKELERRNVSLGTVVGTGK